MGWTNDPPPILWRLPIDHELMLLASRERRPCIRSDSAILAEFPTLNWDGPYRAARFYLYGFLWFGMEDSTALRVRSNRNIQTIIDLLRDIQISIRVYVDTIEGLYDPKRWCRAETSRKTAWDKNFEALKKAIGNAEFLEKIAQKALGDYEKGGRPPAYWKSDFVSQLAELWRIMTGQGASKDLSSSFASFVSAAWASLGSELPETSWDSQIRRREEARSAAELVESANSLREHALKDPPETNPDKT